MFRIGGKTPFLLQDGQEDVSETNFLLYFFNSIFHLKNCREIARTLKD
jgi:hypothetical protein